MAARDRGSSPSGSDQSASTESIARLAEDLVPALSATLAAAGLAEVEVRRPGWRVRVRRATGGGSMPGADGPGGGQRRRGADRGGRGHGADRGHTSRAPGEGGESHDATNGTGPSAQDRPRAHRPDPPAAADPYRAIATSPAVGPFRPARDLRRGSRVRAGDRLGVVDLLGVPQEVMAPVDGIVMAVLVEADDAVEFGQPLVELERASTPAGSDA